MQTLTTPRLFSLYYGLVAAYICWSGMIVPARALLRGFDAWWSIPLLIIPAFVVVLIVAFAAYSLYAGLEHSHETVVVVHCGLFVVILFLFLDSRSAAIIALTTHACMFVLYLFPRTQRAFAAPQPQASAGLTRFVKRVLVVGLSVAALGIVAWCSIGEYAARTMSAQVVVARLVGLPPDQATDAAVREALLTQVPVGTSKKEIRAFLESKNIPRNQFIRGQFASYRVEQFAIVAVFTDPPWTFSLFSSYGDRDIRFVLDTDDRLTDIVIVEEYY